MIMNALNGVQSDPQIQQAIIPKADKDFEKKLDFKDIKFPLKIRDIHKIEKKNCIGISVFGYENKEKRPISVSKKML